MSTTREKVEFLDRALTIISELDTHSRRAYEEVVPATTKINVSIAKKISNTTGEAAEIANKDAQTIIDAITEMLETFYKDEYNTGEIKDVIRIALVKAEEKRPTSLHITAMDISCDGNEDVSNATVGRLNEVVSTYSKEMKSTLLDLSAIAGSLKSEEMCRHIGISCEGLTNNVILMCNKMNTELMEFAGAYKLQLNTVEDIAGSIRNSASDIKTNFSGKVEAAGI